LTTLRLFYGNSATGKTTLVDLVREYEQNGVDSGVNFSSKKRCKVLEGNEWREKLLSTRESIVFIDEGNKFVESVEFASLAKRSDNYLWASLKTSLA